MFQYEFNYEKLLKDDTKINFIKSFFAEISENDFNLRDYFSKDNLDFLSKEISMQYFFKGEDSLFASEEHMEKFKNCKNLKASEATENGSLNSNNNIFNQCEIMKLKMCENILTFEADVCVNFHKKINMLSNSKKQKSENLGKDNAAFSEDDSSNEFFKTQKPRELEIKINNMEKEKASRNAGINNFSEKEQVKNKINSYTDNKDRKAIDSNTNGDNSSSSFIANKENIVDDLENLKKKFNFKNKLNNKKNINLNDNNNDFNNSNNQIEESLNKLIELKNKNEHDENMNYQSKQNNKFISLDFKGNKQDALTQENGAFAEKDLSRLFNRNNLRKSK